MPISNQPEYGPHGTKFKGRSIFEDLKYKNGNNTPFTVVRGSGRPPCYNDCQENYITAVNKGEVFFDSGSSETDVGGIGGYPFCACCGALQPNPNLYCYVGARNTYGVKSPQTIQQKIASAIVIPNVGDKVRAIDTSGAHDFLTEGKIYTVLRISKGLGADVLLHVNADRPTQGSWRLSRFEIVTDDDVSHFTVDTKGQCICGAWKTGSMPKSPLHSSWCPEYDDTPPVRAETQEELVARIRAGKPGLLNGKKVTP